MPVEVGGRLVRLARILMNRVLLTLDLDRLTPEACLRPDREPSPDFVATPDFEGSWRLLMACATRLKGAKRFGLGCQARLAAGEQINKRFHSCNTIP